ncbi:Hypothetical_protein [Hexamita inflata]|uniref:Hypothetical_protein n=1 Tax=Hexamita inflata TaxID=28002 RepID=A0ABP1GEE8_9EUKA
MGESVCECEPNDAWTHLFSFTSTQRIPESVAACSIGEDGFALVFGCLLTVLNPAHSHALPATAILLLSSDSPAKPSPTAPLWKTVGALWNFLAIGARGAARKKTFGNKSSRFPGRSLLSGTLRLP